MPFFFIILVDCCWNALQPKEIYVDNEANLTLHGFVQVLFLVAICLFISSVFVMLFVIILFFSALHQFQ
jgi:hypothetical protein